MGVFLPSLPPSIPSFPFPSPLLPLSPFPSPPLLSTSLPSFPSPPVFSPHLPSSALKSRPLLRLGDLGELSSTTYHLLIVQWDPKALKLPQRVRVEPGRQTVSGELQAKNRACSSNGLDKVYKRYKYMIDRKKPQYVTLYVSHNIPSIDCAMGPKSFSAVTVGKTTVQSERHTKSNALVVLQGYFSRL